MKRGNIFLVLPKASAYDLKPYEVKNNVEDTVKKYIDLAKRLNRKVYCCAQDVLALKLLKDDPDIIWVSMLNTNDTRYFNENMIEDSTIQTKSCTGKSRVQDYITQSDTVYRIKSPRSFDKFEDFTYHKKLTISKKVRAVCNNVIKHYAAFVIYLNAENNFCSVPHPKMGDGKRIIIHNLESGVPVCVYGGVPLDEKLFVEIVDKEGLVI